MADLMERVDTTAEPVHAALTLQYVDDDDDRVDDDDNVGGNGGGGGGGGDVLNEANTYVQT